MKRQLTSEEKCAARQSAAHWKRMIAFVKRTKKFEADDMRRELSENYYCQYCALCILVNSKCKDCILAFKGNHCSNYNSVWRTVAAAESAAAWLTAARRMLTILRELACAVSVTKKSNVIGDTSRLCGDVSPGLYGFVSSRLHGDVSQLTGDITGLIGDVTGHWGDVTGIVRVGDVTCK